MIMRGVLIGLLVALIGVVVAAVILGNDSDDSSSVVLRASTVVSVEPTQTTQTKDTTSAAATDSTATATPTEVTSTPEPTGTPEPTATPEPTVGNITDLVSAHGHPSGYDFARLRIPIIEVDAPVGESVVSRTAGAQMSDPDGPATTLWYDLSEWSNLGGIPGEGGNAIFSGHRDLASYIPYADVTYLGVAVFWELDLLSRGDQIFIDYNGETLEYVVQWTEQINAGNSARWTEILSADVAVDSITLYTCGGEFDINSRSYADRVIVRAERA